MATTVRAAPEAVVSAVGMAKVYGEGETSVAALAGVDAAFARGQFTSIMGPSGSGKSTVMVTHDPTAAASADRVVFLGDGRLVDELAQPTADRVLERMKRLDRREA